MSDLPTERLMKFSRDAQASKKAPDAVRCGDLLGGGAESESCKYCSGSGIVPHMEDGIWVGMMPCPHCDGTGHITNDGTRPPSSSD